MYVFNVFFTFFFQNPKKHDFLRFFELLHTFSRTVTSVASVDPLNIIVVILNFGEGVLQHPPLNSALRADPTMEEATAQTRCLKICFQRETFTSFVAFYLAEHSTVPSCIFISVKSDCSVSNVRRGVVAPTRRFSPAEGIKI